MRRCYGNTITGALVLLTLLAISGVELAHAEVAVDPGHQFTRDHANTPEVCPSCDCSDCALLLSGVALQKPTFVARAVLDVQAWSTDWSHTFLHHVRPPPHA